MAFCPNCGSQVEGNFCPKCGSSVAGGPPPPVSGPSASGLTDNVAGALAYIPIVGIIFLLIEPYNRNRSIRFHAFQGLFLLAAVIVVQIVISILTDVIWSFWILHTLVRLASIIIWLYCMFKAYSGARLVLPVIGPLAEKQA